MPDSGRHKTLKGRVAVMSLLRNKQVRWLSIGLAVVLVAVVAVRLLLPAEKIRDLALDQARAALGRDVTVGSVSVSLRGGLGVRLADFAIANPAGFDGPGLLSTRALDLKLALKPLFRREIRVDRLVVDQPEVHLVRRADGSNNFTFAAAGRQAEDAAQPDAGESSAPAGLSIARLNLRHGSVSFTDEGAAAPALQGMRVSGLGLSMSLADRDPGHYDISGLLAADGITLTGPENVPELSGQVDFDLSWAVDTATLDLQRAAVSVLGLPVGCTGRITVAEGLPHGALELRAAEVALTDLAVLLPAELAGKLKGGADRGRLSAVVNLDLTGRPDAPLNFAGTTTVSEADLALLQPFLPPDQAGQLAGHGELTVAFAGKPGDPVAVDYHGTAAVHGVSYTGSGLVDDLLDFESTVAFTPEQVSVQSSRAVFGAGTFELKGTLQDPWPYFLPPDLQQDTAMKTPSLTFELHAARLDVDRWLPAASPTGGNSKTGTTTERRIPDDLEFPALTCEGTFTADTLLYMQVPLTAVRGRVSVQDRVLSINDVKGQVYNGTVGGQVAVDLNNLQDPSYEGSYEARNIEIDNFATRFAGLAGVVFGGASLSGQFATNGLDPATIRDHLTLQSDAELADGRVVTAGSTYQALNKLAARAGRSIDQEQRLRDLATHISVSDGRVHLNALKTRLGQLGDVSLDGYYGFNGDLAYTGAVLLTEAQTDDLFSGGLLGELGNLLGGRRPKRLEIPLAVTGTRAKPQVKLELDAVAHDLQKLVVQEQGDKLEDDAKRKLGDLLKKWR